MKRILAAFAALASASAFAQSNVTISALLDNAVSTVKTRNNGESVRKTGVFHSGMSSNYLRFAGREELSGGWYSMFRLEAGLATDTGLGFPTNTNNQRTGAVPAGGLAFNRWAYVGLGHESFGEVRLGRVYTAAFENFTPYDPFFTNGIGSSSPLSLRLGLRNAQTTLQVSNAIEYLTPHQGKDLHARITLATGENPSNGSLATSNPRHAGDHIAGRVGYASGPLSIGFTAGLTRNTAGTTPTGLNPGDYLNTNLSVRYDLGWVRLYGQYVTEEMEGTSSAGGAITGNPDDEAETRTFLVGAVFPVGSGNVKVSYVDGKLSDNIGATDDEKGRLIAVGYDYSLSKRTTLYTAVSHISNNSAGTYGYAAAFGLPPSAGESSSGLSLGMRHTF